jgi:hypothetical protein
MFSASSIPVIVTAAVSNRLNPSIVRIGVPAGGMALATLTTLTCRAPLDF